MNTRTTLGLGLVSALLAIPASAQTTPPATPGNHNGSELAQWPGGWAQDYKSVDLGDLDGDGFTDALVHEGGRMVVFPWLDIQTAPTELTSGGVPVAGVVDARILPGAQVWWPNAQVAAVSSRGLEIYRQIGADYVLVRSAAGDWSSVVRLDVADWNGDGLDDVLGLTGDGTTVCIEQRTPLGGWVSPPSVTLPVVAVDFLALERDDGDPEAELALLDSTGLTVYDPDDDVVTYSRTSTLAPGQLAKVTSGAAGDDLAWLVGPDGNGTSYILVVRADGGFEVSVMAGYSASTIASGELNNDGRDDLVVTSSETWQVRVFENAQGSTGSVLPANWITVDATPPLQGQGTPSGFTERPVIGDLEGDGIGDTVFSSIIHGGLLSLRGGYGQKNVESDLQIPPSVSVCAVGSTTGELSVQFSFNAPTGPDHYQVVAFEQPSGNALVTQQAVQSCPITATGSTHPVDLRLTPTPGVIWELDDRLFHILVVPVDSNDDPVGEPQLMTLTFDTAELQAVVLEDWDAPVEWGHVPICGGGSGGGLIIGGIASTGRMPPFGPGAQPNWEGTTCTTP